MQRIAESELIINSRGAVYHLNLRPEELAHNIITVGDPDRVNLVSQYFDSIESKFQHREFISHTGFVGKKKVTAISTGIGPYIIEYHQSRHFRVIAGRCACGQFSSLYPWIGFG